LKGESEPRSQDVYLNQERGAVLSVAIRFLVKIAASSVNTVDTMIRKMGKDLPLSPDTPAILGMDFAGTVEAVGDGVKDYSIGDEIYGKGRSLTTQSNSSDIRNIVVLILGSTGSFIVLMKML
jgi:NADPH:quinone reductase-like Zn-dependent oxidoreductase